MIDFARLAGQLGDFAAYRREEDTRHADRLRRACQALGDCRPEWEAVAERAGAAARGPLRAIPQSDPGDFFACGDRPATVTVVATDGSQIFPDRHVDPACYLINVGRVALHYGTLDPPLIQAEPDLRYRQQDLLDLAHDDDPVAVDVSAEVVSALRDEKELHWLFETAHDERRSGRQILALADGTLIRWMLRGMKNRRVEDRLLDRYVAELERFRAEGIPIASYISRPGNAEVVNLLRFWLGEEDFSTAPDSLRGLLDRHLFEAVLANGERTPLFASGSEVLQRYGEAHQIRAFYVRGCGEVGRVEVPAWVAEQPGWLDLIHAVVLDQCDKGGGYPIILQEAHQRAVVRAQESEMFYRILARQVRASGGAVPSYSGKAASKRAPRV